MFGLWSRNQQEQPQGIISHNSALAFYGLTEYNSDEIHMTVPERFRKKVPQGVNLHKASLNLSVIEGYDTFMVTRPAQTLSDMRSSLEAEGGWGNVVAEAAKKNLVTEKEMEALGLPVSLVSGFTALVQQTDRMAHRFKNMEQDSVSEGVWNMIFDRTMTNSRRVRAGFTLVELLVVIAIISILSAMLLPALNKGIESARGISCSANMRALSQYAAMYLNDYDDNWFYCVLPDNHHWWQGDGDPASFPLPSFNSGYLKIMWRSSDYVRGSILNCPAKGIMQGYNGACSMDYMYSRTLTESTSRGWYGKNNRIKYPSRTPVFGETIRWDEENYNSDFFFCWGTIWSVPDGSRVFQWSTHLEEDNFAYADGHVSSHGVDESMNKSVFVWDTRQE